MPNSGKALENNRKFNLSTAIVIAVGAFFVGLIAASFFWHFHSINLIKDLSIQVKPLRQNDSDYKYINPLLGYEVPGDVKEFNEYQSLTQKINSSVAQANNSSLNSFSVYFRDLTLGRWAGINENSPYAPGSMMKVAIMISYYKEAESDPSVLQKTLAYSSSTVEQINGVPFSSPSDLQVGKSYTVEHLIEAMIINSDNGAKDVLLDNINQNSFIEVHTDLGLPNPANSANYSITAKQYSVLLRVLYNATYLGRKYSEKALQIMSEAQYNQGLVAGVPQGTMVAQKFGEAIDSSNPNIQQIAFSNCGIIYHKTHPYILCVMTKGSDAQVLQKTIALISKTVWNEVNNYAISDNY